MGEVIVSPVLKLLAMLLGGLAAWMVAEPYRLVTERRDACVPNLPEAWEGKRIALLADLHVGLPLGNTDAVRRAVARIVRLRPAATLVAGDFIHDDFSAIERSVGLLHPLVRAGIPVYAVLGNHDHAMPTKDSPGNRELARKLTCALASAGIRVLANEVAELRLAGDSAPLFLVGIGSHTAGEDRVAETLAQLPPAAPRLVMMHHPASFDACPPHTAPFTVAGHTHGGQVRLPLAPVWRYLTEAKEVRVFVGGWIESGMVDDYGQEGNRLYITRGIGCSVAPLRLFCPPELTLFSLSGSRRPIAEAVP